jgi:hypothetical protein
MENAGWTPLTRSSSSVAEGFDRPGSSIFDLVILA